MRLVRHLLAALVLLWVADGSTQNGFRAEPAGARLEAGMAAIEIQFPKGTPLGGYGSPPRRLKFPNLKLKKNHLTFKPNEGYLDPIRAKALVIRNGNEKLVFLSMDVVGANLELWDAVLARLKKQGYSENNVIVSATHTHSGPGALSRNVFWAAIAMDFYQKRVFKAFMDGIFAAVEKAEAGLRPAEIRYTSFEVPGITRNRRGDRDSVDRHARTFWIRDHATGELMGTMVNFAIHGIAMDDVNLKFSADTPGGIERALESRMNSMNRVNHLGGTKTVAMLVNGAEGDISPSHFDYEGIEEIGKTFSEVAASHVGEGTVMPGNWVSQQTEVEFGPPGMNVRQCVAEAMRGKPNPAAPWFGPDAALGLGRFFPDRAKLFAITWGGLKLMTWPGEPINELGRQLRMKAIANGATDALVLGLSNGHLAYFVTPEEFYQGGYESCTNFYGATGGVKVILAYEQLFKTKPVPVESKNGSN